MKFFFQIFKKKKISSNLAKLCSKKAIFKNLKKKFWKKIIFFEVIFFPKNASKLPKIIKWKLCWRFQIGKTLRFSKHIDFLHLSKCYFSKLAKNPKIFSKKNYFWKSDILDTIFDFWLILHTQTICLMSCYHDYSRNFFVTCIPFAHQRMRKIQSAIRYPVVILAKNLEKTLILNKFIMFWTFSYPEFT